jgi:hypothetical protein
MTVKLNPNEILLKAGDTSHNATKGKLMVTNQRIYFKPLTDDNNFTLEIIFDNILEVLFYSKGLFREKGLNINTRDNKSYTFPLKKHNEIGMLINKMY